MSREPAPLGHPSLRRRVSDTGTGSRITLLCAAARGLHVLECLIRLAPEARLTVVSFPEEPGEPRYLGDIRHTALMHGAEFIEARSVGRNAHLANSEYSTDVLLAVSWRYMVPPHVYRRARKGAFVLHDSLLPRYRGFAPTVWAMVNGDDYTGATLFEMADDVDSGPIVDQRRVPIGSDDTISDVMQRVTSKYLELLEMNLPALLAGTAIRQPQDHAVATYTCKRTAADGEIDWTAPSRTIHDLVRAHTHPYWGAFTTLARRELKVWATKLLPGYPQYVGRVPGRIVEVRPGVGAVVLTGDGAILATRVQVDGEPVTASEILKSPAQTLGR